MPKPAITIYDKLISKARGLNLYLGRIDKLQRIRDLRLEDAEKAYAGALLEFHAFFETSIENLFLGLLRGRIQSPDSKVRSLTIVNSDSVARAIVFGGRNYVDWLPYERFTITRAKAFFSRGRPFTQLDNNDHKAFRNLSTIRNALAHHSSSSNRAFKKAFIDGKPIQPRQRRPSARRTR